MLINGEDIGSYGAMQCNVTMDYPEISNGSEWEEGWLDPFLTGSKTGFKKIKVSVILTGKSREEIWRNGRKLIAKLLEPSVIKLDGFSNFFCAVLKNANQAERSLERWHKATLELEGYEYGEEMVVRTQGRTLHVTNPGDLETPAVIEIMPIIGKLSLLITGAARNRTTGEEHGILIKKLSKDKKIIINAESGLVTEEGLNKFQDVELWEFPSLKPGENQIAIDQDVASLTIRFKPRYL